MSRGTASRSNLSSNRDWRPIAYYIRSEEQPITHGPMNVVITIGPKMDAGEPVPVVVLHPQSIPTIRQFFHKHGFDFKELLPQSEPFCCVGASVCWIGTSQAKRYGRIAAVDEKNDMVQVEWKGATGYSWLYHPDSIQHTNPGGSLKLVEPPK